MQITVQVRNIYGVQTIYPLCSKAQLFAAICNTKTLTREAIKNIKALGYSVHVQQDKVTV